MAEEEEDIDWQTLDQEYLDIWDWLLKECDGCLPWTCRDDDPEKMQEYQAKKARFEELCQLIDSKREDYYFCWLDTVHDRWVRGDSKWKYSRSVKDCFDSLCRENENFNRISQLLASIPSEKVDRYFWLTSLYLVLEKSLAAQDGEQALDQTLDITAAQYRLKHKRYSEIFDCLLQCRSKENFRLIVLTLCEHLNGLHFDLNPYKTWDYPVELVWESRFFKIESLTRKEAASKREVARQGLQEFSDGKHVEFIPADCEYRNSRCFLFCESDFVYPHLRQRIMRYFRMFKDVAVVDYFFGGYLVDPNNSIFSRWQDETTMIADRWSTEHVQAVKDHFLTLAEEGHTQWRQRFEAGIKSSTPEYGELFIMNISQISRNYPTSKPLLPVSATNDESAVSTEATTLPESQENSPKTCCNTHLRVDNLNEIEEQYGGNTTIGDTVRAGYLPEWLENRQRASFEAYKSGENLKDAGKRIGEQYGNKAITGDTVRKDAEKHAARHGLELPKRKKGRPSTS